jgi:glycosyltransferase involved in cell wall biosynthesis
MKDNAMSKTATIIITCKGKKKALEHTLGLYLLQDIESEVIIVNYNSPDGLQQWLQEKYSNELFLGKIIEIFVPKVLYYNNPHAKNVGLKEAHGDRILFASADYKPHTGLLTYLNDRFKEGSFITMLTMLYANREDLLKINGFNEELDGWGYDTEEITKRLEKTGKKRIHLTKAPMYKYPHPDHESCMYLKPPYNQMVFKHPKDWKEIMLKIERKKPQKTNQEWGEGGLIVGAGSRWINSEKPVASPAFLFKWDKNKNLLNEKELIAQGCKPSVIEQAKEKRQNPKHNTDTIVEIP